MDEPLAGPELIDRAALIAALRRSDEAAIRRAYAQVFRGETGRLVLAHMLKEAGVGFGRPRDMGGSERAFMDGCAFAVIGTAKLAGFDQVSVLLAAFTDEIEGPTNDRSGAYGPHADTDDDDPY